MFFVGGGGLETTGVVQTQVIADRAGILNRKLLSIVQTWLSLKRTAASRQHVSLSQRNAPERSLPLQMHLIPASVGLLATGEETHPWITGASDHVAEATAPVTCVLVTDNELELVLVLCMIIKSTSLVV